MVEMLVVDDERTTVEFMKDFLEQEGFKVRTACSGQEALDAISIKEPELILLDFQMPGMDGLQTLKLIKAKNPQLKVMMVTGETDTHKIEGVLQSGADYYISKPFRLQDLVEQVREIISRPA